MPKIKATDGTALYCEEAGTGTPVVFVHEFAGDYRTWEPQMRFFSRTHRCVTYSQRGYPPSDVPSDPTRYGQDIARTDVIAVMDALGIKKAHVVGHSMGAYTALHVGMRHPERCISVTAAGCGWGSLPDPFAREAMRNVAAETAKMFTEKSIAESSAIYADGPTRQAHKNKDPRGFAEFAQQRRVEHLHQFGATGIIHFPEGRQKRGSTRVEEPTAKSNYFVYATNNGASCLAGTQGDK